MWFYFFSLVKVQANFFCVMYAKLLVWLFRLNDLLKNFPSTWPKMAEFPSLVWRQEMWATWHVQCTKLQNKWLKPLSPHSINPTQPSLFRKLEIDSVILWKRITLMQKGGRPKMKWKGQKEEVIASIFLISSVLLFLFWTDRIFNLRNKEKYSPENVT